MERGRQALIAVCHFKKSVYIRIIRYIRVLFFYGTRMIRIQQIVTDERPFTVFRLAFTVLLLSASITVSSQTAPNRTSDTLSPVVVRRPWVAVAEVAGLNLGINLFDRYALNAGYARVTGESIKNNLTHRFLWDNDNFATNLFWHPYSGGLYFNAARANGLTFWQSVPFAIGGSYFWELFYETQPPSLNDIIATPVGGMALGEMTHRVSRLLLDDSKQGWERVGRELLAGIISPMDLFNRLLNGDARRHRLHICEYDTSPARPPVQINLSAMERFMADMDENRNNLNWALNAKITYGQPFTEEIRLPYDFFTAETDVNIIGNQPFLSAVSVVGLIWGKEWQDKDNNWLAGIFQHYDYYHANPVVKNGKIPYEFAETASFGGGVLFRKQINKKRPVIFLGSMYVNGILLGANESDYLRIGKRNYNMGNGYSIKSSIMFSKTRWNFMWGFKLYRLFTGKGYGSEEAKINGLPEHANADYINAQGNKGNTFLGMTHLDISFRLSSRINLSIEQRFYFRNSHYDYLQDIATKSTENRIKVTYTLFGFQ